MNLQRTKKEFRHLGLKPNGRIGTTEDCFQRVGEGLQSFFFSFEAFFFFFSLSIRVLVVAPQPSFPGRANCVGLAECSLQL